nr:reverse transcriptase domain-containing protein [Tanacetum cinerariifolium]
MEELCHPTLNGQGGLIAPIAIQATNFRLKNDMIQQVQNSSQFHGLPGDDANKHLDKFLHVTQSIKVNGVTDDALRLYLFPHSLTHHATAWFDHLPKNSITTFEQMAKIFVEKYFPPSIVTKLRNEITNFYQRPDESLFEAWERYKLSIDRCHNHNMLPATQIDTFYNGLTLRHRDTINAAAGGTFMKRRPEDCYDLIRNMTAHTMIGILLFKGASHLINQQVKAVAHNYETCAGPHSYNDCLDTVSQTQNVYAVGAYNQGVKTPIPNFEPVVALVIEPVEDPVSALKPNLISSIPYPSRLHDQKLRDKTNDQKEKFSQISQDLNFNISFTDALILMPMFGPTIKSLLTNRDKLFELARTPLNEYFSAVLLKKLPEKLGDPGKFLISCDFPKMDECLALADLDTSINLMPLSMWKMFSLPELSPTCMTLELADHLIFHPVGVAEDVFVKVGTFHFPVDFVVVNQIDLINVSYEEYSQEVVEFSVSGDPTPSTKPIVSTSSPTLTSFRDSDFLLEETDAFLAIDDEPISLEIDDSYYDSEGDILLLEEFLNDDPSSPPLPPQELKVVEPKNKKSSIDEPPMVELKKLPPHLEYAFVEGDDKLPVIIAKDLKYEEKTALIKVLKSHKQALACFTVVENEENELIPTRLVTGLRVCIDYQKLNDATRKDHFPLPFLDQMLERLAGNEYYCFLDGLSSYFQIPIDPQDQEKTTFTCPYEMFAYRRMPFGLCNAPGTFQRCMMVIFHDMIKKTMEVFMDDFSVFRNSFETCLSHLDKMLKQCEDTNLCINWEKSHFMVKEGIILDHKISKNEIRVDKAEVDIIAKLPHPTTVKGIRSILGHAGFYR